MIKDLKQLYPILSDISIEESNIDINQRSVSTSDYPVMNNCECLSPFSNSPISNNSEELLSGNSNELFNYNPNEIRNNEYPSPSSSISDVMLFRIMTINHHYNHHYNTNHHIYFHIIIILTVHIQLIYYFFNI